MKLMREIKTEMLIKEEMLLYLRRYFQLSDDPCGPGSNLKCAIEKELKYIFYVTINDPLSIK